MHFFDFEPIAVRESRSYEEWLKEDFEECVQERRPACDIPKMEMVDHQVVRNESKYADV